MSERKVLSTCESMIMKVIWDGDHDLSVQELTDQLQERFHKDYKRTTIATYITKLSDKGFISTYRIGKFSYIKAIKSEDEYKRYITNQENEFWFQGNVSHMVAALCSSKKMTKDEIQEIRRLLDELDD